MGFLHLIEHKELQTNAILLHDKKIMMLLETSLVCTTLHIVVFEDLELLYTPLHFNTLLLYDFWACKHSHKQIISFKSIFHLISFIDFFTH